MSSGQPTLLQFDVDTSLESTRNILNSVNEAQQELQNLINVTSKLDPQLENVEMELLTSIWDRVEIIERTLDERLGQINDIPAVGGQPERDPQPDNGELSTDIWKWVGTMVRTLGERLGLASENNE